MRPWFVVARLRGPQLLGPGTRRRYRALVLDQPLVLTREPTNPVDPNAVIASDLFLQPLGYIERKVAAVIAPRLDNGEVLLATVARLWQRHPTDPNLYSPARVLIRRDGQRRIRLTQAVDEHSLGSTPISYEEV